MSEDHPEEIKLRFNTFIGGSTQQLVFQHSIHDTPSDQRIYLKYDNGLSTTSIGHIPRETVVDLVAVLAYWLNHGTLEIDDGLG